jgi:hypothetical protein
VRLAEREQTAIEFEGLPLFALDQEQVDVAELSFRPAARIFNDENVIDPRCPTDGEPVIGRGL